MNIRLRNIYKTFNNNSIINDLSANFPAGSFNVIQGENGSGKTTILEMIAGIINQDSGHIYFDKKVVDNDPPFKRRLFYIPQNLHKYWALKDPKYFCFIPDKSVEDNLKSAKNFSNNGRGIPDILDMFDLYDVKVQMPNCLSFGLQQRLALARAFMTRPYLIMFDEPLSSLDEKSKNKMIQLIKDIHINSHITILYVTHDIKETEEYNALHYTVKNGGLTFDLQEETHMSHRVTMENEKLGKYIENKKENFSKGYVLGEQKQSVEFRREVPPAKNNYNIIYRGYKYFQLGIFTVLFFAGLIVAKLLNVIYFPFVWSLDKLKNSKGRMQDSIEIKDIVDYRTNSYDKRIMAYFYKDMKKIEDMSKDRKYREAITYAEGLREDLSGTELEGKVSLYIYRLKKEAEEITI